MNIIRSILTLLLVIVACVVGVAFIGEPSATTGLAHPETAGMRIGGDGLARFLPVANLALIMFSAMLILFSFLLYLGISRHRRTRQCRVWITVGTIAFLAVWWGMFATYSAYLETGEFGMFLGYPVPTAFMVYGLWLAGFIYVVAYVVGFRSFVFTHEDEQAYHDLVEKFRQREETD
jgi:hypothetical protein